MNLVEITNVNKTINYDLRIANDIKVGAANHMREILSMDDKGFNLLVDIDTENVYLRPVPHDEAAIWTGRGDAENKTNIFTARELVSRLQSKYGEDTENFGLHKTETGDGTTIYQVKPWEDDRTKSPLEEVDTSDEETVPSRESEDRPFQMAN